MRDQVKTIQDDRSKLQKAVALIGRLEKDLEQSASDSTALKKQLQTLAAENHRLRARAGDARESHTKPEYVRSFRLRAVDKCRGPALRRSC
mmetsp:Transcript_3789/g.10464  ORF Transcript_3789/g.10464 Transcript_3789/m.10464 type:complete len:91 (-) Transcript_3789:529-801(-)